MRLILASGLTIRLRLLRAAGIDPEVVVSAGGRGPDVEQMPDASPQEVVAVVLAQAKARDVAVRHPGWLVLGADSVLTDGRSLGKPLTAQVAVARWRSCVAGRRS